MTRRISVMPVRLGPALSLQAQASGPGTRIVQAQGADDNIIVSDAGTPRATAASGGYNGIWTAQRNNAENVRVARDNPEPAARCASNWNRHRPDVLPLKR